MLGWPGTRILTVTDFTRMLLLRKFAGGSKRNKKHHPKVLKRARKQASRVLGKGSK